MKIENEGSLDLLVDAVGLIDESLLAEYENACTKEKEAKPRAAILNHMSRIAKPVAIAACLALIIGACFIGSIFNANAPAESPQSPDREEQTQTPMMTEIFTEAEHEAEHEPDAPSENPDTEIAVLPTETQPESESESESEGFDESNTDRENPK